MNGLINHCELEHIQNMYCAAKCIVSFAFEKHLLINHL